MFTITAKPMAGIWKSIGLSLVFGSALAVVACSTPMPVKPAAQASTAKPTSTAVSASKAMTETKATTQTQAVTTTMTTTETKPAAAEQSASASKPMVMLYDDAKLGKILVDAKGMALYIFDKDSAGKSTCTGDCLVKWPIVSATDEKEVITAGAGVTAKLGVIKRDDGKFQVTANGMPLYYYASDKAAGDLAGQAVGNVWWAIGADGKKISK